MAEMRHPMDFWKALLIGEIFIYVVYMFFGIFVYSYQVKLSCPSHSHALWHSSAPLTLYVPMLGPIRL
jgi:hypothetical protein